MYFVKFWGFSEIVRFRNFDQRQEFRIKEFRLRNLSDILILNLGKIQKYDSDFVGCAVLFTKKYKPYEKCQFEFLVIRLTKIWYPNFIRNCQFWNSGFGVFQFPIVQSLTNSIKCQFWVSGFVKKLVKVQKWQFGFWSILSPSRSWQKSDQILVNSWKPRPS